jgi:hypothetical protein
MQIASMIAFRGLPKSRVAIDNAGKIYLRAVARARPSDRVRQVVGGDSDTRGAPRGKARARVRDTTF